MPPDTREHTAPSTRHPVPSTQHPPPSPWPTAQATRPRRMLATMTLNASFAGATGVGGRKTPVAKNRLQGRDRGLDVLIGLVILVAQLMIGALAVSALYVTATSEEVQRATGIETSLVGFGIAALGTAIIVGVTVLVYLVRIATRKPSWRGPLIGSILMVVVLIFGYILITSGP